MQIIPVIDIRQGIVVRAQGGSREHYPPLKSVLSSSVQLKGVLADILDWYDFPTVYLADLDAIENAQHRPEIYTELLSEFPQLNIWLDAGFRDKNDLSRYSENQRLHFVLGSETFQDIAYLRNHATKTHLILSLDSRHGQFMGLNALLAQPALWPQRVIVMDLDKVGANRGPSFTWLTSLMQIKPETTFFVAGGVRNEQDLYLLAEIGAAGALIASALHTGQLDKAVLKRIKEQEHRPS